MRATEDSATGSIAFPLCFAREAVSTLLGILTFSLPAEVHSLKFQVAEKSLENPGMEEENL
jgi:hypothetical protein